MKATTGASSLRMKGDVADDESSGRIGLDEHGGTGQVRADQSKGESKADTDVAVAMLAGKWTKMATKGQGAKDIAGMCDLNTVLGDAADGNSDATRGKTTTLDGGPAKDPVHLSFSDFDKPVPAKKPTGKVIDLDTLGG